MMFLLSLPIWLLTISCFWTLGLIPLLPHISLLPSMTLLLKRYWRIFLLMMNMSSTLFTSPSLIPIIFLSYLLIMIMLLSLLWRLLILLATHSSTVWPRNHLRRQSLPGIWMIYLTYSASFILIGWLLYPSWLLLDHLTLPCLLVHLSWTFRHMILFTYLGLPYFIHQLEDGTHT